MADFEAQGVNVLAAACDITDRDALAQVFERAKRELSPLRGIVHAATVIDDGLIRNLDAERIHNVLAPKIDGARHLEALTQEAPLDFFVVYSSATTLFGNPGQANYVAANHWLEAFAARRRSQGYQLPAYAGARLTTLVSWRVIPAPVTRCKSAWAARRCAPTMRSMCSSKYC